MSDISGLNNEFEFVKQLNGKKISELTPLLKDLIEKIFPFENENSIIKSWKNHYPQKTDIFIKINNTMKGLSIKKGNKNSVHVERISDFIHFLIENKVEKEIIIEYLKYHYADGSTNGSGNKRLSSEEYKKVNADSILKINKRFNSNELITKAIERFIIKGNNSKYPIDAIIYGEVNDFFWITKEDIRKIILSKKEKQSSAIHFGPLICQPKNRCLNHNPIYEKDRFSIQIKWYSLFDDIIENMNNNVIKSSMVKHLTIDKK